MKWEALAGEFNSTGIALEAKHFIIWLNTPVDESKYNESITFLPIISHYSTNKLKLQRHSNNGTKVAERLSKLVPEGSLTNPHSTQNGVASPASSCESDSHVASPNSCDSMLVPEREPPVDTLIDTGDFNSNWSFDISFYDDPSYLLDTIAAFADESSPNSLSPLADFENLDFQF